MSSRSDNSASIPVLWLRTVDWSGIGHDETGYTAESLEWPMCYDNVSDYGAGTGARRHGS